MRTRSLTVLVAAVLWPLAVSASEPDRVISVPHDVATLEEAIGSARPGDLILLDRGTYRGGVVVPETVHDITIRGVDRNDVVFDGGDQEENAIYVLGDDVVLENMTAHHYTGNGFYWSGVDGFLGRYLTVYDVGLYGIYTIESRGGRLANSLVSGAADAAFYIGECDPCDAVLTDLTARLSAIGYSGTNASDVTVTDSLWERNGTGILPNSYDVGKAPPPEERSTFTGNVVRDSGRAAVPLNTPLAGFWGLGVGIAGGNHNTVAGNVVQGSARYGIVVYPTVQEEATWVPEGNAVTDNRVSGSGIADLALSDGSGPGNCFQGNEHASSLPAGLDVPECGAGATGSPEVGADLAIPPPVAEEAAAGAAPFFSDPPLYSEMPPPPSQPSLPDTTGGTGNRGPGLDLLSVLAAGVGLALVLAAVLARPLRRRRSVGVALVALGGVLVGAGVVGLALRADDGERRPNRVENASPSAAPTAPVARGPTTDELGGRIVYSEFTQERGRLYVRDGNEEGHGELIYGRPGESIFDVRWSPNGEAIAFSTIRDEPPFHFRVLVLRLGADRPVAVTNRPGLGSCRAPAWSPDGTRLAIECGTLVEPDLYRGAPRLYVTEADGSGTVRRITRGWGQAPTWSPNGEVLAFQSYRDGNFEIYAVPVRGSGEERLTRTPQDDTHPAWSPDGSLIAFDSERQSAKSSSYQTGKGFDVPSHIYVMSPDGSDPERVTPPEPAEELFPRWVNGEVIAFSYARDQANGFDEGIGLVRASGSEVTRISGAYGSFDWTVPS